MGLFDRIFRKETNGVIFVRKENKKSFTGQQVTYEIYRGTSKESALRFLEEREVNKTLYYIIVDTAEGSYGRDIDGIYRER